MCMCECECVCDCIGVRAGEWAIVVVVLVTDYQETLEKDEVEKQIMRQLETSVEQR